MVSTRMSLLEIPLSDSHSALVGSYQIESASSSENDIEEGQREIEANRRR